MKKVLFLLAICFQMFNAIQACPKCKITEAKSVCLGKPTQVKFQAEWNPEDSSDCPPNGNIRYMLQFDDGNGFKDVGPNEYEGSSFDKDLKPIEIPAEMISKAGFWKVSISLEGTCIKSPPKEDFTDWGPDSPYASFDVIFVNLNIGTVADNEDEVEIGGFLCLNDDDDDGNLRMDKKDTDTVAGENDLVVLKLDIKPSFLSMGDVILDAPDGGTKVKVWKTFTKGAGNEVSLPATFTTSNMPTTLFLEGIETSENVRDIRLKLSYNRDSLMCHDEIKATVISVDLGIDTVQEDDEETIGGLVCLNYDDDDKSMVEDRLDPGAVANEDDLVEISLDFGPIDLYGANLKLTAVQGDSKIKIWEDANRTTPVALPKTWVVGPDTPRTLFVEGFETSVAERDVELKLEIKYGSLTCEDKVKATVISIKLQKVSFSGDKYYELKNDKNLITYNAPQWLDKNLDGDAIDTDEKEYPMAFRRKSIPKLAATFKLVPALTGTALAIKGENDKINVPSTPVSLIGDTIEFPETPADAFPDVIAFYDKLEIKWSIKTGNSNWTCAGKSKNRIYLTWDDTKSPYRQETIFNLGSRNAAGLKDENLAITAIYSDFTDQALYSAEDTAATNKFIYYLDSIPYDTCGDLNGLLAKGNGKCGTFMTLFYETLRAQGITKAIPFGVDAPKNNLHIVESKKDFIKYALGKPGVTHNIRNIFFVKNWSLNLVDRFTSIDNLGVGAQGNTNPISVFGDHGLVEIDTKIYDPSYGTGPFTNLKEWEDASVDGFGVQIYEPILPSVPLVHYLWAGDLDIKGLLEVIR